MFSSAWYIYLLHLCLGGSSATCGTIEFVRDVPALWVRAFPEERPATLQNLFEADRKNHWGLVTREAATYRVAASLWIGDEAGLGTYFQIGSKARPAEILIIDGNVWIRPARDSFRRPDGQMAIANRLSMGVPGQDEIRPRLSFVCDRPGEHGLFLGRRSNAGINNRAELRLYNATISAARPDRDHAWGVRSVRGMSCGFYGSDIRLVNTTFSWFKGTPLYGSNAGNSRIEGCLFEHGGTALQNGHQVARNCTFRDLGIAVAEGGALSGLFYSCTFENNRRHWSLGSVDSGNIELVDCKLGKQQKPLQIRKNRLSPAQLSRLEKPIYPSCLERYVLVIQVRAPSGLPLPGTMVIVTCPEEAGAVEHGAALTGPDGSTPVSTGAKAILVTRCRIQATDSPDSPSVSNYSCIVTARKTGFQPAQYRIEKNTPVPHPLVMILKR